ncbi:MAG: hypothetical protein BWY09_00546 [Candidatus Hydrogenedentes bacterium ADurb.Bin179]|nr:MAG: hypothetical protein BWY09_00546 [Candidatus Hydrogenedentes bacterium ADurb.Bin179]
MDLSGLKWPVLILVIVGIGFLASSPGINFMVGRYTKSTPGQNAELDTRDEVGLTHIAGYLLYQWRYQRAYDIMKLAVDRYGASGANCWYNKYRMAKCLEKLGRIQESCTLLEELMAANAHAVDARVADNNNLKLRITKIKEVNELQ